MPTSDTPRLSPSIAKLLVDPGKGPASVWRQYLAPDRVRAPQSMPQKRGDVIDALVFGTKEVKIGNAKTKHDPKTQIVVSPSLYAECSAATSSISSFLSESGIELSAGTSQEKLRWTEDGVQCSGSPDHFDPESDTIIDLKTSYSLRDDDVKESIDKYSYEVQSAAYIEAYKSLGRGRKRFAFLFAEKEAPYLCRWVIPGVRSNDYGYVRWQEAKIVWKDCLASGKWPGPRPLELL